MQEISLLCPLSVSPWLLHLVLKLLWWRDWKENRRCALPLVWDIGVAVKAAWKKLGYFYVTAPHSDAHRTSYESPVSQWRTNNKKKMTRTAVARTNVLRPMCCDHTDRHSTNHKYLIKKSKQNSPSIDKTLLHPTQYKSDSNATRESEGTCFAILGLNMSLIYNAQHSSINLK